MSVKITEFCTYRQLIYDYCCLFLR